MTIKQVFTGKSYFGFSLVWLMVPLFLNWIVYAIIHHVGEVS